MVECDLANSPISNTFNNLTRLRGTAKSLKIRARRVCQRVRLRVLRKSVKSHSAAQKPLSEQPLPQPSQKVAECVQLPSKWCTTTQSAKRKSRTLTSVRTRLEGAEKKSCTLHAEESHSRTDVSGCGHGRGTQCSPVHDGTSSLKIQIDLLRPSLSRRLNHSAPSTD